MASAVPFDRSIPTDKSRYRDQIKAEFDHRCAYCGRRSQNLTLDHVHPHCQGGGENRRNLIPACGPCNRAKGSRSLLDWYTPERSYFTPERLHRILEHCGGQEIRSRKRQRGGFG